MGSKYDCPLLWRETLLYWTGSMPTLCSAKRMVSSRIVSKTAFCSKGKTTLSFKSACYRNILEKRVQNKGQSVSHSQYMHKCKRPVEDRLPTTTCPN